MLCWEETAEKREQLGGYFSDPSGTRTGSGGCEKHSEAGCVVKGELMVFAARPRYRVWEKERVRNDPRIFGLRTNIMDLLLAEVEVTVQGTGLGVVKMEG